MTDAIDQAWAEVLDEVNEEFDRVIEDPSAFAAIGFVDQDIVDTGRLRDSKKITVEDNKLSAEWDPVSPENGYHYGSAIKNGFFAYGGKKYVPGRDWPDEAIANVNPAQALVDKLKKMGIKAKVKYSRL